MRAPFFCNLLTFKTIDFIIKRYNIQGYWLEKPRCCNGIRK